MTTKTHSWLFAKKRGNRRTDSQVIGLIAEVGFAVFCILAGVLGIVWITWYYIIPEWQIHKNYERTTCVLEDFRIIKRDLFTEDVVSAQEEKKSLFTDEAEGENVPAVTENSDSSVVETPTAPDAAGQSAEMTAATEKPVPATSEGQTPAGTPGTSAEALPSGSVTGTPSELTSNAAETQANQNAEEKTSDTAVKDPASVPIPPVLDTGSLLRQGLQKQFLPELYISYEVNGVGYKNWTKEIRSVSKIQTEKEAQSFLAELKKGGRYYCWYDTADPENVIVSVYWSWENFCALLIPLSLLLLGLGALVHLYGVPTWGSKEYSAMAAQRAARRTAQLKQLVAEKDDSLASGLPEAAEIIDSPGIRLAYRLPMEDSPAWNLLVVSSVTLFWNLFVLGHVALFCCSVYQDQFDWIRLFFIILPFGFVGVLLAVWTIKKVRSATLLGPTLVELNQFPIARGETANLFLSQGGHLKVFWFNVLLVCEEEVVFTHGTNTRREVQRVFQRQLFCEENFEIKRAEPFETQFSLLIPSTAMHSFVSSHNQVKWKIVVQGTPANSPAFERSFPLIVLPEIRSAEVAEPKTNDAGPAEDERLYHGIPMQAETPTDETEEAELAEKYEVPDASNEVHGKEGSK